MKAASPTTDMTPTEGCVTLMSMHLAKGLEFRTVVVMACDEDILPLQQRIETASDESELVDFLTPNGTCFTSPAPGQETDCW